MKKIRVLYTIPNFDTAGSGRVLYELAKNLDKSKFEIEIACRHKGGKFFKEVEELGFPIHILNTSVNYKPFVSLLARVLSVSRFFKENNYDIIHSWHWSSDWTEPLAARMARVKWIYTKKAMSWGNRNWKIRSRFANFIITINEEMKLYFPNKKAQELIPIGIDTEFYKPHLSSKIPDGIFHIVTVANLVPVKGIENLLQAIALMDGSSIQLKIVGDNNNEYGKGLASLAHNLKIADRVIFTGKVLDVRPFISESDLYIIPTLNEGRKEGMPMALVEAMSLGIPVLGSNISGINFVLKEFPELLFPTKNATALKEKIESIRQLSIEARNEIGFNLRQYCIENFTIQDFIRSHEKVYMQCVKLKKK